MLFVFTAKQNRKIWMDDEQIYKNWIKNIIGVKLLNKIINHLGLNDDITDRRQKVVFTHCSHTFALRLGIWGTPIYTIKELMGHKTLCNNRTL